MGAGKGKDKSGLSRRQILGVGAALLGVAGPIGRADAVQALFDTAQDPPAFKNFSV